MTRSKRNNTCQGSITVWSFRSIIKISDFGWMVESKKFLRFEYDNYIEVMPYVYQMPCKKINSSFFFFWFILSLFAVNSLSFFDFPIKFTDIWVDQFQLKTNKLNFVHFPSIRYMTVCSILHALRWISRGKQNSQLNFQCTYKHMFDPNNVYTYWAIDQQIEFEWCGSAMDRNRLLWEVCC